MRRPGDRRYPRPVISSTESPAVSVTRRWSASSIIGWLSFLAATSPVGIMMIGGGLFGMEKPSWWASFPGAAWGFALFGGLLALVLRGAQRPRPGRIATDGDTVSITRGDAMMAVPRGELRGGAIAPLGKEQAVALQLSDGRTVTVSTTSMEEADALLRALGLDPEQRRFESRFTAWPLRWLLGFLVVLGLTLAIAPFRGHIGGGVVRAIAGIGWLAIAVPVVTAWVLGTRPPEVIVGADGVTTRGALRRRYIPFRDIESVSLERAAASPSTVAAISLALRDGRSIRVPIPTGNDTAAAAVRWRIQLGLAAAADAPDAPARLALLGREGRAIQDWRRNLASIAGVDAGYRAVPLSRADLETILDAPSSTVEQRLGAAIALWALARREASSSSAPRLRIAAEQCAGPRLRVALGELAEGTEEAAIDEAVAEALAEQSAVSSSA